MLNPRNIEMMQRKDVDLESMMDENFIKKLSPKEAVELVHLIRHKVHAIKKSKGKDGVVFLGDIEPYLVSLYDIQRVVLGEEYEERAKDFEAFGDERLAICRQLDWSLERAYKEIWGMLEMTLHPAEEEFPIIKELDDIRLKLLQYEKDGCTEDDVQPLQTRLMEIEREHVQKKGLLDQNGHLVQGQAILSAMLNKNFRRCRLLLEGVEKVDQDLYPYFERYGFVKDKFEEILKEESVTEQRLAPFRKLLLDLEAHWRPSGYFQPAYHPEQPIPKGQAAMAQMRETCYDLLDECERLLGEVDQEILPDHRHLRDLLAKIETTKQEYAFTPDDIRKLQLKLHAIDEKFQHHLGKEGMLKKGTAVMSEMLDQAYNETHEMLMAVDTAYAA
eukprot:Clim_evm23s55 gene=Clim_evmTU23s55